MWSGEWSGGRVFWPLLFVIVCNGCSRRRLWQEKVYANHHVCVCGFSGVFISDGSVTFVPCGVCFLSSVGM